MEVDSNSWPAQVVVWPWSHAAGTPVFTGNGSNVRIYDPIMYRVVKNRSLENQSCTQTKFVRRANQWVKKRRLNSRCVHAKEILDHWVTCCGWSYLNTVIRVLKELFDASIQHLLDVFLDRHVLGRDHSVSTSICVAIHYSELISTERLICIQP